MRLRLPSIWLGLSCGAGAIACTSSGLELAYHSEFTRHAPPGTLEPSYRPLSGYWIVVLDRLRQTEPKGGVLRVTHETRGRARIEIAAYGYGGEPGAGAILGIGPSDALEGATFVRLDLMGAAIGTMGPNGEERVATRSSKRLDTFEEHRLVVIADPATKRLLVEVNGVALFADVEAPGRVEGGLALLARGSQSFRSASSEETK